MPNDMLGLQVPVWITDIAIVPCTHQQPEIITVSKYHKVSHDSKLFIVCPTM